MMFQGYASLNLFFCFLVAKNQIKSYFRILSSVGLVLSLRGNEKKATQRQTFYFFFLHVIFNERWFQLVISVFALHSPGIINVDHYEDAYRIFLEIFVGEVFCKKPSLYLKLLWLLLEPFIPTPDKFLLILLKTWNTSVSVWQRKTWKDTRHFFYNSRCHSFHKLCPGWPAVMFFFRFCWLLKAGSVQLLLIWRLCVNVR